MLVVGRHAHSFSQMSTRNILEKQYEQLPGHFRSTFHAPAHASASNKSMVSRCVWVKDYGTGKSIFIVSYFKNYRRTRTTTHERCFFKLSLEESVAHQNIPCCHRAQSLGLVPTSILCRLCIPPHAFAQNQDRYSERRTKHATRLVLTKQCPSC